MNTMVWRGIKIIFRRIGVNDFDDLMQLQKEYKQAIIEEEPENDDFEALKLAVAGNKIEFYGCEEGGRLIAMCSVFKTFSTFDYKEEGVFENFYIRHMYRHQGIARRLVEFAYQESGVSSLTVGCSEIDLEMYKSLGFRIHLGTMLAYGS